MLSNRWFILSVLFLARISMGYQFQSIGSVSPSLIKEFASEYAAIGTLIGLQSLPGLLLSLPSGILGNRFGDKRAVLWGLLLMTAGTILVGISHSFPLAATGRLVSGIGAVLLNVIMTKMVADWFSGKEIITAMAIFVNSWPTGIGLALVTQPSINSEGHNYVAPIQRNGKEFIATLSSVRKTSEKKPLLGYRVLFHFLADQNGFKKRSPTRGHPSKPFVQLQKKFNDLWLLPSIFEMASWTQGAKEPFLVVVDRKNPITERRGESWFSDSSRGRSNHAFQRT